MDGWVNEKMDGWRSGWMREEVDKWKGEWINGWMGVKLDEGEDERVKKKRFTTIT